MSEKFFFKQIAIKEVISLFSKNLNRILKTML